MATLRVQDNSGASSSSVVFNLTGVLAGDLVVVSVRERDNNALGATPITDTVNSTTGWVQGPDHFNGGRIVQWYNLASAAGDPAITVSFGSVSVLQGIAAAFAPNAGGNTFSLAASNEATNSSGTAHNAGSVTLGGVGVLVAGNGIDGDTGGETDNDGYTAFTMEPGEREYHRYKLSNGETVDADFTTVNSVPSAGAHMAFLETSAGGGGTVAGRPALTLLGVG